MSNINGVDKSTRQSRALETATHRLEQRYGEMFNATMAELTHREKSAMTQQQALKHIAKIERVVQGRWLSAFGSDITDKD